MTTSDNGSSHVSGENIERLAENMSKVEIGVKSSQHHIPPVLVLRPATELTYSCMGRKGISEVQIKFACMYLT